jgi:hypothetical protein
LKYSDQELTALRYGKPLPAKPGETLADQSKTSVVLPDANKTVTPPVTPAANPVNNPVASNPANVANQNLTANNQPVNNVPVKSGVADNATKTVSNPVTQPIANPVSNPNPVATNVVNPASVPDKSAVNQPVANNPVAVNEPRAVLGNNATVANEPANVMANNMPADRSMVVAPSVSTEARAMAGAYSPAEASSMYFNMPATLEKDLFVVTSASPYSAANPIPVDAAMPSGIYYKVQVGAFRNNIPQNLYDEFAPVAGESLSNGITRYTAGYFLSYGSASDAKAQIRNLGYNDAFIVAYRDGKRVPLYDAMGKTEGANFMDLIETEYVHGDSAPKQPVVEEEPLNTSYYNYKKYPDAARVNLVESIKGLFFTVQVGVYSQPVPSSAMFNISPLNSEFNERKQLRYSSGIYMNMEDALGKRDVARQMGIKDAFVTAYYNGRRISLTEADKLLSQYGPSILTTGY